MWRNEQQTNDAIFLLLDRCGLPALKGLWTREGPTESGYKLLERGGGYLSGGEGRMLLAAFDLACRVFPDGVRAPSLSTVMTGMDPERARLCFSLAMAIAEGSSAIDDWIGEQLRDAERESRIV